MKDDEAPLPPVKQSASGRMPRWASPTPDVLDLLDAVRAGEAALAGRWPGVQLSDPAQLDGGPRALVVRCSVTGADVPSVVVKLHGDAPGRESHVREPAGLEVLAGAGVPRLLAVTTTMPPGTFAT